MNIVTDLRLPADQYVGGKSVEKTGIVLHFTAGTTVGGALAHWIRTPERVGTAYIVGLAGEVHEVFPPDAWAFHLGLAGAARQDGKQDIRTIGIEVVNVGPLIRKGDMFYWWNGQLYCHAWEMDRYYHTEKPWRGFEYFAKFSKKQKDVLPELVGVLCDRFGIRRKFLPTEKRLEFCLDDVKSFNGIMTHANYREDKFDIGPAFDWRIIGG